MCNTYRIQRVFKLLYLCVNLNLFHFTSFYSRYVVQTLPQTINWRQVIMQGDLRTHFTQTDLNQMSTFHNLDMTHKGIMVENKVNHKGDSILMFGEVERHLLNSYDPVQIKELIAQMKQKFSPNQIRSLSQKVNTFISYFRLFFSNNLLV